MCGIGGIVSTRPVPDLEAAIARMVEALRHRGPDGIGTCVIPRPAGRGHVVFGHARLSILDLTTCASQPMYDPETGNWLVYNGELYNYQDVRAKLESLGHNFTSTGDTEVLLKALGEWGEDALARFEGMYALGFWEASNNRLMLARGPVGIKPLVYAEGPDSFVFGSELASLRASGLVSLSLDHDAIDSFLYYGAVIEPRTMFREAKMLPAGSVKYIDLEGSTTPRPTRGLPSFFDSQLSTDSFKTAVERVDSLLAESVESQLVSDVPLGIALSGGIDSTLITSYAARSRSRPDLRLLTVDTDESGFSEGDAAHALAKKLGLQHEVARLSASELLLMLPRAIASMDQPTVDGVNTFIISRVADRQGIRVLLSGLGGDEVFGGYTTFNKVPVLQRWARPLGAAARYLGRRGWGRNPQINKVAQSWPRVSFVNAYLLQRAIRWRESLGYLAALPSGPPDATAIPPEAEALLAEAKGDSFRRIASMENSFYMRNQLLRDADIFSSAHGVEMRVPFLDTRLMRYALTLPPEYHVKMSGKKRILRHLVRKDYGSEAGRRRKMGFVLPWDIWLRREMFEEVSGTLLNRSMYETLGIDVTQAEKMLNAFKNGDRLVPWQQVWSLYALVKTVSRVSQ